MGTETCYYTNILLNIPIIHVKLKNPLMGTETRTFPNIALLNTCNSVKLKNPLMGTETVWVCLVERV